MIQTIKEIALFLLIVALMVFTAAHVWNVSNRYNKAHTPEITQPVLKIDQVQRGNTLITICTDTSRGQVVPCTTIFLPL